MVFAFNNVEGTKYPRTKPAQKNRIMSTLTHPLAPYLGLVMSSTIGPFALVTSKGRPLLLLAGSVFQLTGLALFCASFAE